VDVKIDVENSNKRKRHRNQWNLPQDCDEVAGTHAQQTTTELCLQDVHNARWKWKKGEMHWWCQCDILWAIFVSLSCWH